MTNLIRTLLFLFALNFLSGNIPGIMPQLGRLAGTLLLAAWAGLYFPFRIDRSRKSGLMIIPMAAALPLLTLESFVLSGTALMVFCTRELSADKSPCHRKELDVHLITLFLYTIITILYSYSPYPWYLFQKTAPVLSHSVTGALDYIMGSMGYHTSHGATLSHNAMGFLPTLSVLCHYAGVFTLTRMRLPTIFFTVTGIVMVNAAWLCLVKPLSDAVVFICPDAKPTAFDFQSLLLFLMITAAWLFNRNPEYKTVPNTKPMPKYRGLILLPVLSLVITACLVLSFRLPGPLREGKVLFCDRNTNWEVPVYGKKYGQGSTGMFGLLPEYLKMRGIRSSITSTVITPGLLEDTKILTVFNPGKPFAASEKETIREFVNKGGSLLVAGDHTDVSGIMGPINEILAPFDIRLNFDTVLPIRSGWVNSLEKRKHPTTGEIRNDNETAIWVGASLETGPCAMPVIIGKRGWADKGDYANKKRAFLGDYKRNGREQLGDLVLVAESALGRGKVLVFGDTSTFQNGVMPVTWKFLDRIFDWLSRERDVFYPGVQSAAAGGLFLTAFFLAAARCSRDLRPTGLLWLLCIISADSAVRINSTWISASPGTGTVKPALPMETGVKYKPVFIDTSHHERLSVFGPSDDGVWGLSLNLMRNGRIPMLMDNFSGEQLAGADLFFVIAPTTPFSGDEIEILTRFMENGGTVVWTVGWEESAGSASFLDSLGLSIDSVPLGKAACATPLGQASFVETWPIVGDGASMTILAEKFGYPIMIHRPVGKGGLVLAADSWFLLNKNLETYKKYNPANIRFFRHLIHRLKIGGFDSPASTAGQTP
ncbi:MAG: hypothetical protein GY737_19820 [Desulfobacteraceae bacterium]|nr:hypothetical protein [Desulfobacteraceae bacterium]